MIHTRLCTSRARLCWEVCLGLRHIPLLLHAENKSSASRWLAALLPPGTLLCAPGSPCTQQTSSSVCSPGAAPTGLNISFIPFCWLWFFCCFFSFFLYLLPKLCFLLFVSLSPSLSCCWIPSWAWAELCKPTSRHAEIYKCKIFHLNRKWSIAKSTYRWG